MHMMIEITPNTALRIASSCKRDSNPQQLHDETKVLLIVINLKLHATQLKQLTQTQTYPLHDFSAYSNPPRNTKATIFHKIEHTKIIISDPDVISEKYRENLELIHTPFTS